MKTTTPPVSTSSAATARIGSIRRFPSGSSLMARARSFVLAADTFGPRLEGAIVLVGRRLRRRQTLLLERFQLVQHFFEPRGVALLVLDRRRQRLHDGQQA